MLDRLYRQHELVAGSIRQLQAKLPEDWPSDGILPDLPELPDVGLLDEWRHWFISPALSPLREGLTHYARWAERAVGKMDEDGPDAVYPFPRRHDLKKKLENNRVGAKALLQRTDKNGIRREERGSSERSTYELVCDLDGDRGAKKDAEEFLILCGGDYFAEVLAELRSGGDD